MQYFVGEAAQAAYLAWIRDHAHGFVVNCDRKPRATYLRLHAATCKFVTQLYGNAQSHTKAYGKACSVSKSELEAWAKRECGPDAELQPCAFCM